MPERALRLITNVDMATGIKTQDLRMKTLNKIMKKKRDSSENADAKQKEQWLMAVERAAWRRGLAYSSSSTSSYTSEEDDVTRKEMFSRIRARLNKFDSDSDCTSSSEDETMNYGGGPGIRMRKMRRVHQIRRQLSTVDTNTAEVTQTEDNAFDAHLRTALSVRSLPQGGAKDRLQEVGIVSEHSQLKLVVCGSSKKLTVTFLGLRSFTQVCKMSGLTNHIFLKLSLSPDTDSRIRHKTKPERVTDDVTMLHDTFTFDITHRDVSKRMLISAWSKTGDSQRSAFIGCMSFGVRNIISNHEVIQGWYYFLRENLGRRKHLKVKTQPSVEAKRRRTPRRQCRSRDSESGGSRSNNSSRTRSVRRRFSTRSGSSDSSLASGYAKTCVYDQCSCNCCVIDEEDRQRRRLSKLSKRRRVSVGVSTPGVVYYDLQERIPNEKESPIVTSSVTRRDVVQAVEKRSCDVVSGVMQKMGTKTPCGRRNLQRKNYSSDDLFMSRISYCTDPDHEKEDDDVFVGDDELKQASLHRMETRAARIVSPTSLAGSAKHSSSKLEEFTKPSDSVSKLRNLRIHNIQPIKFDFEPEAQPPSPGADDRGYHSDTGRSTSSTTSEESVPSQQSSTESDYVYLSSGDAIATSSQSEGCRVIDDLIKSCDAIGDDVKEPLPEEKSKPAKFFSIKTWLHRKAGDADSLHRPVVSLKTSQSQRRSETEATKLRRTASLRKPKRNACENCFINVQNLSDLLEKKGGVVAFRAFLQREYSEENLDFWIDCQNFKLTKPSKARKVALKIYERYVATGSPNEINIDGHIREETKQKLNQATSDTFDAAQIRIFKLMERDSFRRFLVSDLSHKCKA